MGRVHRWTGMKRGITVLSLTALLVGAMPALTATGAEPGSSVALRVLVVDDGSVMVDAIASRLELQGVPYTSVELGDPGRPVLTDTFLATGDEGHFQAVVLPTSTGGSWTDTGVPLAAEELAALRAYTAEFGVRQVDAFEVPGPHVGLQPIGGPGTWAGSLDGLTGTVTAAGAAAGWGYLEGQVPFVAGSWAMVSQPLTADSEPAVAPGTGYTSYLTVPIPGGSGSLLGSYTDGAAEHLVVSGAFNGLQRHFLLLAPGIVTWLTRGVHFGFERNYYAMQFDDAFAFDARWDTENNCTPGEDCPPGVPPTPDIRMTADDVAALLAWQDAVGYRPTLAFNGYYALHDADGEPWASPDPLTQAFVANAGDIRWLNHGYEHIYQGCVQDFTAVPWRCVTVGGQPVEPDGSNIAWVSQEAIEHEIMENARVGRDLGLPFDESEYLPGEHSGLLLLPQQPVDNPAFAAAIAATGIATIGADASRGAAPRVVGGALTVPRHPAAIYFNVSTEAEEVDEYNWLYLPSALGGSGICEAVPSTCLPAPLSPETGFRDYIVPTDVLNSMQFILANDPRPFYAHVSNLTGPDYLGLQLMSAMLETYDGWFTDGTPLVNVTLAEAGETLRRHEAWAEAGMPTSSSISGRLHADGSVTIANPTSVAAPLTMPEGTRLAGEPFGEPYRGQRSAWVTGSVALSTPVTPPSFTSAGAVVLGVGVEGTFTVTATGADAITLGGVLPAGVVFTDGGDGTATIAGRPEPGTAGSYPLVVTATNRWGAVSQDVVLTVLPAPSFTSAAAADLTVGAAGSFTVTTLDATSLTLTGDLPEGVTFTDHGDGTATLAGTPAPGSDGDHALTITAANAATSTAQAFVLTVRAQPAFTSAGSGSLTAGVVGELSVTASGWPRPTLTLIGDLPAGVTFVDDGDGTGRLGGTPVPGSAGTYSVTVTAANTAGSVDQPFTLTIHPELAITSAPATGMVVGSPASFTVTTTGHPTPTLVLRGTLPAGVDFVDEGDGTGTLSGTPAPGTAGTYPVVIAASDDSGVLEQPFVLTVHSDIAFASPGAETFVVGKDGTFVVRATGATSVVVAGDLPPGVTFTDHGDGTGTLAGTPEVGSHGTWPLRLTASNAGVTLEQDLELTVVTVPAFTSAATAELVTGTAASVPVNASGWPAPALAVTGQLPAGLAFVDNGDGTAEISGTAADGSGGEYRLLVTATSPGGLVEQELVLDVLEPGRLTDVSVPPMVVGLPTTAVITASGRPVPSLAITGGLPAGVTFTDNGDGTATLTGTPAVGTAGTYPLVVSAANRAGTDTADVTLRVLALPEFTTSPTAAFAVGVPGSFAIAADGAEWLALVGEVPMELVDGGDGTAVLTWTPTPDDLGTHAVTVRAGNEAGTTDQELTIVVRSIPVITSLGPVTVPAGAAMSFTVTTEGEPVPSLTATGLPPGIGFVDAGDGTGVLSGTPQSPGVYPVTLTAVNAAGEDSVVLTVTVVLAPALKGPGAVNVRAGVPAVVTVRASGFPIPSLALDGVLPAGMTFADNGNGTATLSGTAAPGSEGVYPLSVTATNVVGSVTADLRLTVKKAVPASFKDVPPGHRFHADIMWLAGEGITGGYTDGTFRPLRSVSRAQMAAFLYRIAGEPEVAATSDATFRDVPTSHPFHTAIAWLAEQGITGGYTDGTFRPDGTVSRQQMAAFLHRYAGGPSFPAPSSAPFADVPASHVFATEIAWLASTGVTGGYVDGGFHPTEAISRQHMAAFLRRFADRVGW